MNERMAKKDKNLNYFIKDKEYDQSAYEQFVMVSKTAIVAIITVRHDNMCKLIICIIKHLIKK